MPSRLPTTKPAEAPPADSDGRPPAPRKPGVFLVEDDSMVRNMLRSGLERHGFRVVTAASGEEALDLYPAHAAGTAVVLLDARMPGMDGLQTLDALRRVNPDVVACVMSGDTGSYELDDLIGRGVRYVFSKPFSLDDMARTLRALVPADRPVGP